MPERPPMTNIDTKPMANSIGVVNWMLPRQSVPSQLNVLMAEGTAITIVDIMKVVPSAGLMPLWNMWWPHTIQESPAMPIIENAMARYPKIGLRAKTERTSEATPIEGRIRM